MQNHAVVRLPCRRNNLCFSVLPKKENKAKEKVAQIVGNDFDGQCGIIYCARQADTVEMAFQLKEQGISSTFYHAGMDGGERIRNATMWMDDKVRVMCCTNAFGMGIDKKCVRFVIHLTLPSSLEDYVQESGRGGRDGDNCSCIVFFRFGDRSFHLRNITALPTAHENELSLLNCITDFCMQQSLCRQQCICKYFEEELGEPCKSCDICQKDTVHQEKDLTDHARNVIQCLTHLNTIQPIIKLPELVMTYMGSKAKEIVSKNFHTVPLYGKGKDEFLNINRLTKFVQYMIFQGLINENLRSSEYINTVTYLTCGNVTDLLNDKCKVFYSF